MSDEIKDLAGNMFVSSRVTDNTSDQEPAERSLIDKLNAFQNTLSGGESDLVEQAAERIAMLEEQLAASDQELETICKTLDVCERLILNREEELKALKNAKAEVYLRWQRAAAHWDLSKHDLDEELKTLREKLEKTDIALALANISLRLSKTMRQEQLEADLAAARQQLTNSCTLDSEGWHHLSKCSNPFNFDACGCYDIASTCQLIDRLHQENARLTEALKVAEKALEAALAQENCDCATCNQMVAALAKIGELK